MTSNLPIKTTLALTLAAGAIAAPGASARFDLNPPTVVQAQAGQAGAVVARPNPDQQTSQTVPPILPAAKPSQSAVVRQADQQERLAYLARHKPAGATYSNAEMSAYADATPTGVPGTVVHVVSHDGGFDWGDAGIGAAGGLGLALVGVGGAFAISQQRRTRRSNGSAVITG
ncbi:MAG: hypothetical protein JO304_06950 [Solirubrobacterales bacterium]|nr:hypothetical protein [Solirubrobacterales bacterium]MBV9310624.1 hypothetical protein [Solirubrobacterales bacterium]